MERRAKTQEAVVEVEASGRTKATKIAVQKANSDERIKWDDTNAVDSAYSVDITKMEDKR